MSGEFDDIRPYNDAEVAQAMRRIAQSQWLPQLAEFVFPELTVQDVARMLAETKTTREFQHRVMYRFNHEVIRRSVTQFSCEGIEHLQQGPVSLTHLRAHETSQDPVCRLLLEKKKKTELVGRLSCARR